MCTICVCIDSKSDSLHQSTKEPKNQEPTNRPTNQPTHQRTKQAPESAAGRVLFKSSFPSSSQAPSLSTTRGWWEHHQLPTTNHNYNLLPSCCLLMLPHNCFYISDPRSSAAATARMRNETEIRKSHQYPQKKKNYTHQQPQQQTPP